MSAVFHLGGVIIREIQFIIELMTIC